MEIILTLCVIAVLLFLTLTGILIRNKPVVSQQQRSFKVKEGDQISVKIGDGTTATIYASAKGIAVVTVKSK